MWTGSGYGLDWEDVDAFGNSEIYFAQLDANGGRLAERRVTSDSANSKRPSLVWTGTEHGLVWADGRDGNFEIYFTQLDISGRKLLPDARVTNDPGVSVDPVLAWDGSGYGIA